MGRNRVDKFSRTILVNGKFVDVRYVHGLGLQDEKGCLYDVLPNGKYIKRLPYGVPKEFLLAVDGGSGKLGDIVPVGDVLFQWQLDEHGNLCQVKISSITRPERVKSLSPEIRSGYSDSTGHKAS